MNKYSMQVKMMADSLSSFAQDSGFAIETQEMANLIATMVGVRHEEDLQSVCDVPVAQLVSGENYQIGVRDLEFDALNQDRDQAIKVVSGFEATNGFTFEVAISENEFLPQARVKNPKGEVVYTRSLSDQEAGPVIMAEILDAMDIERVTQIHRQAIQEEIEMNRDLGGADTLNLITGVAPQNRQNAAMSLSWTLRRSSGAFSRLLAMKGVEMNQESKAEAFNRVLGGAPSMMSRIAGINLSDLFSPQMMNLQQPRDIEADPVAENSQHLFMFDGRVIHAQRNEEGHVVALATYSGRGERVFESSAESFPDVRSTVVTLARAAGSGAEAFAAQLQAMINEEALGAQANTPIQIAQEQQNEGEVEISDVVQDLIGGFRIANQRQAEQEGQSQEAQQDPNTQETDQPQEDNLTSGLSNEEIKGDEPKKVEQKRPKGPGPLSF